MEKHLHIVTFDIPYPANYGGAIDVFYKIKSLSEAGVKISLHCFAYNGRTKSSELENICFKVYYYQRNISLTSHLSLLPYTVYSRKDQTLIDRLAADPYPVLFEGLMSSYYIHHPAIAHKKIFFRECNIEHDYYFELSKNARNPAKKTYYFIESLKLKRFEKSITSATKILAISTKDQRQLEERYPEKKIQFIPCFHSNDTISATEGLSDYILYHGNLSVSENELAAIYLCENVFSKLKFRCLLSGMKPTERLQKVVESHKNIELIANPDKATMDNLVRNAQINILITNQATGLKIKLLNTLFSGRHLIVNSLMLEGSGLEKVCRIADTAEEQITLCNQLIEQPFTSQMIEKRKQFLLPFYSNTFQAQKILSELD